MNVQERIVEFLKKIGSDVNSEIPEQDLSDVDKSGGVLKETRVERSSLIQIPVKQCEFVCRIGDDANNYLLLKQLNLPEVGVDWSMTAETLYFPVPMISVSAMTISGYTNQFMTDALTQYYQSQFSHGLLNTEVKYLDFIISIFSLGSEGKMKMTPNYFQNDVQVQTPSSSLDSNSLWGKFYKIVQDSLPESGRALPEKYENYLVKDILRFRRCSLSKLSLRADPASNEFTNVTTSVSYKSFELLV